MPIRRPNLKRVALWVGGVILAFALYLAGAPLVICVVMPRVRKALPVLYVVYGPLDYYCRHDEYPGSASYRAYAAWCRRKLEPQQPLPSVPAPRAVPAP